MAHPFFDARKYPWTLPEGKALFEELINYVNDPDDIHLVCQKSGIAIGNLPVAGKAKAMWRTALNDLATAGLLRKLSDELRKDATLDQVHLALDAAQKILDPLEAPKFSTGVIFFGRPKLRLELDRLSKDNGGKSLLLVRGDSKSGKSWTRHIVFEQAKALGEKPIYITQGMYATVDGFLEKIFDVLDGEVPPRAATSNSWYQTACSKMARFAAASEIKRYWIIIDKLGSLDPEVLSFFEQAAFNLMDPSFADHFRLVLIEYPEKTIPTNWEGFWSEDRIAANAVTQAEIADYFTAYARWLGKQLSANDAAGFAQTAYTAAFAQPAADDTRPFLERLHDEVRKIVDTW